MPPAAAISENACNRVVLPIPGSPTTSTNAEPPAVARATAPRNRSHARSRPINGFLLHRYQPYRPAPDARTGRPTVNRNSRARTAAGARDGSIERWHDDHWSCLDPGGGPGAVRPDGAPRSRPAGRRAGGVAGKAEPRGRGQRGSALPRGGRGGRDSAHAREVWG